MLFVQLSKWGDIKGDIDDQKDLKQALDSKADVSNLGQNVVTSVSDVKTYDETTRLAVNTINPETGSTDSYNIDLELQSDEKSGIMPKESFSQITQNTTDIESLKGANKRVPTSEALPDTSTQNDLTVLWNTLTDSKPLADGDTLISFNVATMDYAWTYFAFDALWHFRGIDTVSMATNSTAGIVKGENTAGKIFVENDGTMSLVGYEVQPPQIKEIYLQGADSFTLTASKDAIVSALKFSDGTPLTVTPQAVQTNTPTTFTIDGTTDDFIVKLS